MTCLLFHGPSAKEFALKNTGEQLLEPPYGDEGLTVDDARAFVQRMLWPPVGLGKGFLLVGPVETARSRSLDVLLKSLEDHDPEKVVPVLWAHDLEGVPPTILSRCKPVWSPGVVDYGDLGLFAEKLLWAIDDCDFPAVVKVLEEVRGQESDFVLALAQVAVQTGSSWQVYDSLRELMQQQKPTHLETLVAFASLERFYGR